MVPHSNSNSEEYVLVSPSPVGLQVGTSVGGAKSRSLPDDMKLMTRTHMNLAEKDIAKVNNQNIIFGLVSNNKLLNQDTNKYNFYFITGMLLGQNDYK